MHHWLKSVCVFQVCNLTRLRLGSVHVCLVTSFLNNTRQLRMSRDDGAPWFIGRRLIDNVPRIHDLFNVLVRINKSSDQTSDQFWFKSLLMVNTGQLNKTVLDGDLIYKYLFTLNFQIPVL
jgi:hypothetical protein